MSNRTARVNIPYLKAFLRYWLPIIIWLALIFIGSTDLMSAEHTSRIIGPLLHWLFPTISPFTVLRVQFFMRKLAHVSEYAILAVLLYRAFVHTALKGRRALSAGLVLLLCAAYAATDEFHQSFVPSRTASLRDVMIDICGAMLAVILYWSIAPRRIIPSRSWSRHQSKEGTHSIAEENGGNARLAHNRKVRVPRHAGRG